MAKRKGILEQLAEQPYSEQEDLGFVYRYVNYRFGKGERVHCIEYKIRRLTPTGAWIDMSGLGSHHGRFKRITFGGRSFAYRTKKEALFSFIKRKEKQIEHLEAQLEMAQDALKKAQKGDVEDRDY